MQKLGGRCLVMCFENPEITSFRLTHCSHLHTVHVQTFTNHCKKKCTIGRKLKCMRYTYT